MTSRVQQESRLQGTVMAALVAGALVLSASGSALAAGSKGSVGGSDEFQVSCLAEDHAGATGADDYRLVPLGGKAGVGDRYRAVPLGGKSGVDPGKSDTSGAV
jgi:hypothetical protein